MKTFILSVLVISICVYSFSECSCPVCTIIDNFRNLLRYNSALHSTYKVFTDFGLLRCVQQCMFRTRCQSINFELSTQTCELNQDTSSGPSFRNGSVFTPIIIWPKVCERIYLFIYPSIRILFCLSIYLSIKKKQFYPHSSIVLIEEIVT